jgi:general secretion pathway protein M
MTEQNQTPLQNLRQTLSATWVRLGPRERMAVTVAAAVLGLALLWWVGVAPALATLRQAPEQHRRLDAQLAHMRAMAATAETLRGPEATQPLVRERAQRALEQATASALGRSAVLTLQGEQATVTLRDATPEALSQWLEQVRINARVLPVQAELQHSDTGWSGSLVLAGPGLGTGN